MNRHVENLLHSVAAFVLFAVGALVAGGIVFGTLSLFAWMFENLYEGFNLTHRHQMMAVILSTMASFIGLVGAVGFLIHQYFPSKK